MGFSAGKRKSRDDQEEDYTNTVTLSDLNDDVLEKVLSWLPTSCYFRMTSVCKRWQSTQTSRTFKLACSQVPSRDPWFFMIGVNDSTSSFVYDSTENNWKNLNRSLLLHHRRDLFTPVASSSGLLCFRCSVSVDFLLRNPLTGSSHELPYQNYNKPLQAVAMTTTASPSSYKLVTISGDIPNLCFKFYESSSCSWSKVFELVKKNNTEDDDDETETGTVYFLNKTGNVVVASKTLQRSPSKQYSSVITVKDNVETVYFLSSCGTIIACDLTERSFTQLPKLLPPFLEYSIDLVECDGTMFVILLSEFYESTSLRIWKLEKQSWVHVGMLPPAMSHELYFVYDLVKEEWSELPRCFSDGQAVEFVSSLSFQPRIEAAL
ncbi:F-box only protein 13 [Hirschfeldia incana]|nr:F-box only protein 13 [Hirschfeldia incana]